MRVLSIVGAIALYGCGPSISTVGPYVRNIIPVQQGLIVDSCNVSVETTTHYTPYAGSSKSHEIVQGECYRQVVPTGGVP